jgi:hypothetical protein
MKVGPPDEDRPPCFARWRLSQRRAVTLAPALPAHANARSEVVPGRVPEPAAPGQLRLFDGEATELERGGTKPANDIRGPWPFQRVFAIDARRARQRARGDRPSVGHGRARAEATAAIEAALGRPARASVGCLKC